MTDIECIHTLQSYLLKHQECKYDVVVPSPMCTCMYQVELLPLFHFHSHFFTTELPLLNLIKVATLLGWGPGSVEPVEPAVATPLVLSDSDGGLLSVSIPIVLGVC